MPATAQLDRRRHGPDEIGLAGLKAFFEIVKLWHLSMDDARILLGMPSRRTLYNWKSGAVRTVPHDVLTRLSYIVGIYKALQVLYADPVLADRWIRQPNSAFGGQSALRRMLAGEITDLAAVRDYLDSVRGGW